MVVAWQKRGLYYAINCLRKGHRIIIIMRLPAEVCYTVEGITGLQRPIAWRPTRDIIAAHVHSNRNSTITFFEKNGEKFSSFDLPDYIVSRNEALENTMQILFILGCSSRYSMVSMWTDFACPPRKFSAEAIH